LRLALEEGVPHRLAGLLRERGHDVEYAKELDRLGLSDARVLVQAAESGQTLVVHDKGFRELHGAWVTWRERWQREVVLAHDPPVGLSSHAGILLVPQSLTIDALADILEGFADASGWMPDRLSMWNSVRGWDEPRF
jgi:hypothetical protein